MENVPKIGKCRRNDVDQIRSGWRFLIWIEFLCESAGVTERVAVRDGERRSEEPSRERQSDSRSHVHDARREVAAGQQSHEDELGSAERETAAAFAAHELLCCDRYCLCCGRLGLCGWRVWRVGEVECRKAVGLEDFNRLLAAHKNVSVDAPRAVQPAVAVLRDDSYLAIIY